MGVEKTGVNRLNKTGSIDIYRPPALRKIDALTEKNEKFTLKKTKTKNNFEEGINNQDDHQRVQQTTTTIEESRNNFQTHSNVIVTRPVRKERRPDRAVYIPRARRNLTNSLEVNNTTNKITASTTTANQIIDSTNNISSYNNKIDNSCNKSGSSSKLSLVNCDTTVKENTRRSFNQSSVISTNNYCDKFEPISSSAASLPLFTSSPLTNTTSSSSINIDDKNICISSSQEFNPLSISESEFKKSDDNSLDTSTNISLDNTSLTTTNCDNTTDINPQIFIDTIENCVQNNNINNMMLSSNNLEKQRNNTLLENTVLRIEDVITSNRKIDDNKKEEEEDKEIKELQRASKEINRSNRCIIKQTFNSNILEIPEPDEIKSTKNSKLQSDNDGNDDNKSKLTKDIDPENDDWDSMFDDNGECVDPKILSELTASVGRVKIETPKTDYKAYHMKQSILNDEEFPHVLEVSNFPVEFKTQDLMMIFSQYKESGFDIKWVDDTHALAIFSSSRIAAEVLAMGHPFVLLKPLAEATIESRAKAKKCSASLQPYRPRPETCAALARRLVTGALGVRLKTAAQERENEKRVLREAKERKLLAAKQRDEAWEN